MVLAEPEVPDLLAGATQPGVGVDGLLALGPHEHQTEGLLDRHGDQAEARPVQAGEAIVAVGRGDQPALEVVGPTVETAAEAAGPLSRRLDEGRPAVAADVEERPEGPVLAANDHDGHSSDIHRQVVAGLGEVRRHTDRVGLTAEHQLLLEGEAPRVAEVARGHGQGFVGQLGLAGIMSGEEPADDLSLEFDPHPGRCPGRHVGHRYSGV